MRICEVVKQFYQGLLPRRNRNKNRAGFFHCGERQVQHRLRRNTNRRSGEDMKITALLVLKVSGAAGSSETAVLANASDVSQFGFFQRQSAREFIVFASRTIAGRTPLGQRQSVAQDGANCPCPTLSFLLAAAFCLSSSRCCLTGFGFDSFSFHDLNRLCCAWSCFWNPPCQAFLGLELYLSVFFSTGHRCL